LDRINDPEFEPDEEVVTHVSHLMPHSLRISSSEDAALLELRELLIELLGGSDNLDGIVFKREKGRSIPLVLLEYERVIGEWEYDPSIQAAYSLREFIFKDEVSALRLFCIPTLRVFDTACSSASSSTSVVARLSFLLVVVLTCPSSVPSTPTSSSFSISLMPTLERPPPTKIPGYTTSQKSSHHFAVLEIRWISTTKESRIRQPSPPP
jgi:hypothetical protein